MNALFRTKSGHTGRRLTVFIEEDGAAFDLSDVTTAELVLVVAGVRTTRTMTQGAETGELYYDWLTADYTAIPASTTKYACEIWLTFEDGTTAPVPTVGVNYIMVEARL